MPFLDYLAPFATAASQGLAGAFQGQVEGQQRANQMQMNIFELLRQKHLDEQQQAYRQAQIADIQSQQQYRTDESNRIQQQIDQANRAQSGAWQRLKALPEFQTNPAYQGDVPDPGYDYTTDQKNWNKTQQDRQHTADVNKRLYSSIQNDSSMAPLVPHIQAQLKAGVDWADMDLGSDIKNQTIVNAQTQQTAQQSRMLSAQGWKGPFLDPTSGQYVFQNPVTGETRPAGMPAGGAGGGAGGQQGTRLAGFSEMLGTADDLFSAEKGLDVSMGQSAATDVSRHGLNIPGVGVVPGTQGAANKYLAQDPNYLVYKNLIDPFVIAHAHTTGGARGGSPEVIAAERSSVMRQPGDFGNPTVTATKDRTIVNYLNAAASSFTPQQVMMAEAQIPPAKLAHLRAMGYRGSPYLHGGATGGTGTPSPAGAGTGGGTSFTFGGKTYTVPP